MDDLNDMIDVIEPRIVDGTEVEPIIVDGIGIEPSIKDELDLKLDIMLFILRWGILWMRLHIRFQL